MQKSSPLSLLLAKDERKKLIRNTGIGKIVKITGRRNSKGTSFGNAEKWGWGGWLLLLT